MLRSSVPTTNGLQSVHEHYTDPFDLRTMHRRPQTAAGMVGHIMGSQERLSNLEFKVSKNIRGAPEGYFKRTRYYNHNCGSYFKAHIEFKHLPPSLSDIHVSEPVSAVFQYIRIGKNLL
ncbi:hypothetical protein VTP01DRAFT_1079 [Rhizomucor pusillus]|uniref:uncharacterized protein n=1 Tax=Rhizomucor pusillus TaxID=4840 RepID=UPI003743D529